MHEQLRNSDLDLVFKEYEYFINCNADLDITPTAMQLFVNVFVSIVTVDPPGPLYPPVSAQRNITCLIEGGLLTQFVVT